MNQIKRFSDIVSVAQRFQRSTKLDSDYASSTSLDGFILQKTGIDAINTMARFYTESKQRAFTWTGPYGCGKSSLALFFCNLLAGTTEQRKVAKSLILHDDSDQLAIKTFCTAKPWKLLTLLGHRASLSNDFKVAAKLTKESPRGVISEYIEKIKLSEDSAIIVIDELGKYLENGNSDNCYFLQELAESLNRSEADIIVLGILHQSFNDYATSLTKLERDEWAKVQGRYVDISLLAGVDEILQLLCKSIVIRDNPVDQNHQKAVSIIVNELANNRRIDKDAIYDALSNVWPLNPVVAVLLGPLSRRSFFQNNRSVFNFLTSVETHSFSSFLDQELIGNLMRLYSPSDLWDYLKTNFEQVILSSQSESRHWLLANDCVERVEKMYPDEIVNIAKTVAILDLFRRGSELETNANVIAASNSLSYEKTLEDLKILEEKKILVHRKFLNSYALFEGSDFDLEGSLRKAKEAELVFNPMQICNYLSLAPIIARRHYCETGSMRWYERLISTDIELSQQLSKVSSNGELILCLSVNGLTVDEFQDFIIEKIRKENVQPLTLVGIPEKHELIYELCKDIHALITVAKDPYLEGDASARKEVQSRTNIVTGQLLALLENSFNHARWFDNKGNIVGVQSLDHLRQFLSKKFDQVYYATPILRNELINRDKLSSNITSARKQLLIAMVEHTAEKRLGISQFPPQAALYISLLQKTGIHVCGKEKKYYFSKRVKVHSLAKIWSRTEQFFQDNRNVKLMDLYRYWQSAPFGMKQGVLPVFAMAFLLAFKDNLCVYINDVFQAELTDDFANLMLVDSQSISFKYIDQLDEKQEYLNVLASAISKVDETLTEINVLSVARSIVKIVINCPKWALATTQAKFSKNTILFRNIVLKAKDPIQLIFTDIPEIFGSNDPKKIAEKVVSSLQEIRLFMPNMLSDFRAFLYKSLDSDGDIDMLHQRATTIHSKVGWTPINAFVSRMLMLDDTDISIEGVISLAVSKMKTQWTDSDIEIAKNKIAEWGLAFRHQESLAVLKDLEGKRKLISLVVGGREDHREIVIDLPVQTVEKVNMYKGKVKTMFKELSLEEKTAILIELGMDFLEGKNNG